MVLAYSFIEFQAGLEHLKSCLIPCITKTIAQFPRVESENLSFTINVNSGKPFCLHLKASAASEFTAPNGNFFQWLTIHTVKNMCQHWLKTKSLGHRMRCGLPPPHILNNLGKISLMGPPHDSGYCTIDVMAHF